MKYELSGRTLEYYAPIINQMAEIEEMQDAIVPDSMPDIERIVGCPATGVIRDKEITARGVRVSGTIRADALYVADDCQTLYAIPIVLPFTYLFESAAVAPDTIVLADITIISSEAREINPRKLSVRVGAVLTCRAFANQSAEVFENIEDARGVEYLNKCIALSLPTAVGTRPFTINETVEMPAGREGIGKVNSYSVDMSGIEHKLIQGKAVIKGTVGIKVLYAPVEGGLPQQVTFELPFSQIIELEGADENCMMAPQVVLLGSDLTPQSGSGGEGRELDIGLYMELQGLVGCESQLTPIVDAYSCDYPLEISTDRLMLPDLAITDPTSVPFREIIECGRPIKNVISVDVRMTPAAPSGDGGDNSLDSIANVLIIYISDDGQIYGCSRRFDVVLTQSDDYNGLDLRVTPEDVSHTVNPSGNLELRVNVRFQAVMFRPNETTVVTGIDADTDSCVASKDRPSVILRYPAPGEKLWDIAKHYRTTREAICAANGCDPEGDFAEGKLLLIPKK